MIARDGQVRWARRPTAGDGRTVELVGGAWDLAGIRVTGGWLHTVTEPDLVELFPIGVERP